MSLVGMDLNASRARAVAGPSTQKLALLRLDGEHIELPLALSLEGRVPAVGHAGVALTRSDTSRSVVASAGHQQQLGVSATEIIARSDHGLVVLDSEGRELRTLYPTVDAGFGRLYPCRQDHLLFGVEIGAFGAAEHIDAAIARNPEDPGRDGGLAAIKENGLAPDRHHHVLRDLLGLGVIRAEAHQA